MVKIYAPASIGNINVGFDSLGVAISPKENILLGDIVSVHHANIFTIETKGKFSNILPKGKNNIVYQCWMSFCKIINYILPIKIVLEKNMPISSGLGSSACSIVATFTAMNEFCGNPLNKITLLKLMGEIEGKISGSIHYDNVAPSFLGGMQLIIEHKDIISKSLPYFKNWLWIVAYPGMEISTEKARNILPKKYSKNDCIIYGRYLANFIYASYTKNNKLASYFMKDIIAEPYRKVLIPNFSNMRKEIKKIGALSFGISGSGPTVFAVCDNYHNGNLVAKWLSKNYIKNKNGFVHICNLDKIGVRKI